MRMIEAVKVPPLIRLLLMKHPYADDIMEQMQFLIDEHTIDAVPVVHGRWVDHMVRDWRCSECGEKIHKVRNVDGYCYDDKPNYCPNCGANMRGEQEYIE